MKFIVTFDDISGSLRSEQVLKSASYPCMLDAAPRGLGASCVYIIRTEAETPDEITAVLQRAGISWAKIIQDNITLGG